MPKKLRHICKDIYIINHNEDIAQLTRSLLQQGFQVHSIRTTYTAKEERFSASQRALINHAKAWETIAKQPHHAVVVEADFVPVQHFGQLPLPAPENQLTSSFSYLYSVAPEFWDLSPNAGCMRGHAGGMVAYALSSLVATKLLEFHQQHQQISDGTYTTWDAGLGYWLKDRGIQSYIPFRQYGEHGGCGNPEHARAGLRATDHADVLMGPLSFLPAYANGSHYRFLKTRLLARTWGWGRLLLGRALSWRNMRRTRPLAMVGFAAGRLLALPHMVPHVNHELAQQASERYKP